MSNKFPKTFSASVWIVIQYGSTPYWLLYILYSSMYTIPSSGFWKEIQNASKAMKFYREWPLCGFSDWSLCPQAICCCNSFLYPILLVLSLIWLRILFLSQYLIFGVLCFNIPPVTLRLFLKVFKVFPLSSRLRV